MSSTSSSSGLSSVLIASPALAEANNGNWRTAARWAQLLRKHCRIGIVREWRGQPCDVLIALHARRSAPSIEAWAAAYPSRPLIVVLTGTDLYRDIHSDPAAQQSLTQATRLVVLQERGPLELSPALRKKTVVIYQSARRLAAVNPPQRVLRVINVGHLRDEKDPLTFMRAAERMRHRTDIRFEQIGAALDPALGRAALACATVCPQYRWLGALPHAATRQRIRRAHLLVNTSRMEGGAQTILEAAQSGTAAIASRIPGNLGMLAPRRAGWFEVGDDAQLGRLIERARDDAGFLAMLRAQTLARAPLFEPAEEERHLAALLHCVLKARPA